MVIAAPVQNPRDNDCYWQFPRRPPFGDVRGGDGGKDASGSIPSTATAPGLALNHASQMWDADLVDNMHEILDNDTLWQADASNFFLS